MAAHIVTVIGGIALWTVVVPFIWEKVKDWFPRRNPVPKKQKAAIDIAKESKKYLPLTPDLIMDAIRFHGYIPLIDDNGTIRFRVDGELVYITYDSDIVTLYKGYSLDSSYADIGLMRLASFWAEQEYKIGKIFVADDDSSIAFSVSYFEHTFANFCATLPAYIQILESLRKKHIEIYDAELERRQKNDNEQRILS